MGGFIDVLKSSASAYIKYQNRFTGHLSTHNILQKVSSTIPAIQYETTLPSVLIRMHNIEPVFACPALDRCRLILARVLLVVW